MKDGVKMNEAEKDIKIISHRCLEIRQSLQTFWMNNTK